MKEKIRKNYKVAIVFFVLGIIVSGLVVYAAVIESSNVSYDNSSSGLSSTTLKGAIDELYEKSDIRKMGNFVSAYPYNQTTGSSNYCVTGEEETCQRTNCYKIKTGGSCKVGDIIKYKVNDTDIVTFHVMFDNGSTLTMQSHYSIIGNTNWNSDNKTTSGPVLALAALESATRGWNNVNDQDYEMGTTTFKTNAFTGCSSYDSCTTNIYTLESRTGEARMITVQEAVGLGCTGTEKSYPIWMYNYMGSTYGYWTMSANYSNTETARTVASNGSVDQDDTSSPQYSIRAVVVVSK